MSLRLENIVRKEQFYNRVMFSEQKILEYYKIAIGQQSTQLRKRKQKFDKNKIELLFNFNRKFVPEFLKEILYL